MIGSIGCIGRPTRRMVDSRSRLTAHRRRTSGARRSRPTVSSPIGLYDLRTAAMQSAANRPAVVRILDPGERTGGRQHVLESARRDAGHVLPRPPRGREGDQELAGARVEVVDEQRGLSGLGDGLRGPGPDADHVDEITRDLLVLVLREQSSGRVGVVYRRRQELDFGAAMDQLRGQLPLPCLVVITDVRPGRLARRDVAEDQPHLRPGFGLGQACPEPGRSRYRPRSRWRAHSRHSGQGIRGDPCRSLILDNAHTMIERHGRPSPPSTHRPRTVRAKSRPIRRCRRVARTACCGPETRLDPLVPCPARGHVPLGLTGEDRDSREPARSAGRNDGSRRDDSHESSGP